MCGFPSFEERGKRKEEKLYRLIRLLNKLGFSKAFWTHQLNITPDTRTTPLHNSKDISDFADAKITQHSLARTYIKTCLHSRG